MIGPRITATFLLLLIVALFYQLGHWESAVAKWSVRVSVTGLVVSILALIWAVA